jgi:hypothetical protein
MFREPKAESTKPKAQGRRIGRRDAGVDHQRARVIDAAL